MERVLTPLDLMKVANALDGCVNMLLTSKQVDPRSPYTVSRSGMKSVAETMRAASVALKHIADTDPTDEEK